MINISESKASEEENIEKKINSSPSTLLVSWILSGCVRARGREPIPLEERAVLSGVRLQEPVQGVRVRLTLAVHDGDGYGSEEQEAGARQVNPHGHCTVESWCVVTACSCRMKGETGKKEGPAADISLHPEMAAASSDFN